MTGTFKRYDAVVRASKFEASQAERVRITRLDVNPGTHEAFKEEQATWDRHKTDKTLHTFMVETFGVEAAKGRFIYEIAKRSEPKKKVLTN